MGGGTCTSEGNYKMSEVITKQKILIADDSEMNRELLAAILEEEYDIIQANDGVQAVDCLQRHAEEISLLLLDIVMPHMDGFEVLSYMNKEHWIDSIPVVIISSENSPIYIKRGYDLGATDFIEKPFDANMVLRRSANAILLGAKQRRMTSIVSNQIYEREKSSKLMINILSHIVEFRNGESGLHVLHIQTITEMLLRQLVQKENNRYALSKEQIRMITTASALHDIGKISIPDEILNKPGRLTAEEFAVIKGHSMAGANMLSELPLDQKEEPLVKTAYEICRWHHERYDGGGYPDGLKGDEIPIAAQVVALADVYDALRSSRVYKPPYSHEKTIHMIMNGECGVFNPILLECLSELSDALEEAVKVNSGSTISEEKMIQAIEQQFEKGGIDFSDRTLRLLERERMKYRFFANISQEIQFEYTKVPEMLTLSEWSAEYLRLPEIIMNPKEAVWGTEIFQKEDFEQLLQVLEEEEWEKNVFEGDYMLSINGRKRWNRVIAKSIWSEEEPREFVGAIGKIVDVHEEKERMKYLKVASEHDLLTGLLNHKTAKRKIKDILTQDEELKYILILLDLDSFKQANDQYGHLFGDEVLKYVADTLSKSVRGMDLVARMGGDEFLLFMPYKDETQLPVDRIFRTLDSDFKGFHVSVSMGVAKANECGRDYDKLFHMADVALYQVKKNGKHGYCFYDKSSETMKSVLTFGREEEPAGKEN